MMLNDTLQLASPLQKSCDCPGRDDLVVTAETAGRSSPWKTRFLMLLHLPHGRTAAHVRDALTARITELPDALQRSLTWDQGKELSQHTAFTVDTGVPVYFCDPHSPWQRGSNENTNGLLRQYFPRGTDFDAVEPAHLDQVADSLNRRPRETLGWKSPAEAYAETVAITD